MHNKISIAVPSTKDITLNGYHFKVKDDGFAYTEIFPKQWNYVKLVIKNIEQKEYKKVVKRKRRVTTPKVNTDVIS